MRVILTKQVHSWHCARCETWWFSVRLEPCLFCGSLAAEGRLREVPPEGLHYTGPATARFLLDGPRDDERATA